MDEIARQLRDEIASLEEHMGRTANRFLATRWSEDLIQPFERIEAQLEVDDLRRVVQALHRARHHFRVDGHVAGRIDAILSRHVDLIDDLTPHGPADVDYDDVVLPPDADPGDKTPVDAAESLFLIDDEEPETRRAEDRLAPAQAAETIQLEPGADSGIEGSGQADDLFDEGDAPGSPAPPPSAPPKVPARHRSPHDSPRSKVRDARERQPEAQAETFDIFAHRLEIDDVAAAFDITVSDEQRTFFDARLSARHSDRVVASLRRNRAAAGRYILLPRLPQMHLRDGQALPTTVKNLARRYIGLFGDIRDLMRYRNDGLISSEVPEPGWALITAECPRESMGKNYMEQNQYLRYLAASLSIPSHLVRRRTMVEALYDLIVGQLVLGRHFQRASLDWTASSPAKNDFICVYTPDEGIRVRDLSRVVSHPSLGVTPTW